MRVYFYHTEDLNFIWSEWANGCRFPSHFLYGATHLQQNGVEVVAHHFTKPSPSRLIRAIQIAKSVFRCKEKFDAIYATHYQGLEILVFLRALGVFRKPIIVWQHQPVLKSKSFSREYLSRLFFRGIDYMFFFSKHMKEVSVSSGKVNKNKAQMCPWGADLKFYDGLIREAPHVKHKGYISTGREHRDMNTLISAFERCPDVRLSLITAVQSCNVNYENMLSNKKLPSNIELTINRTMSIPDIARRIWAHKCICICCKETNYTVGLTTLVEALALGLPVIISRNPNQPFDVGEAGCGISVPYGDVQAWVEAIQYIEENPHIAKEMGRKGRELAENIYNIDICAKTVAEAILSIKQ